MRSFLACCLIAQVALISVFDPSPNLAAVGPQTDIRNDPRVISALELLEVWIDAQLAYDHIPGISAAIVHDQDLLWSRGFGYADLEAEAAISPQTIFSICSVSKLFTSIAVMQLRDAGKLNLDDPIDKHLPWFDIQQTYTDVAPATVRSLLTHTSGLPRESPFPYWTDPTFPFPTREAMMESVSGQRTLYPTDRYFQYSNLGMALLGEIVGAASSMPYDSLRSAEDSRAPGHDRYDDGSPPAAGGGATRHRVFTTGSLGAAP